MTETASGEENIQQMIMEGGSVETAFTVYTDFEDYDGGIYQCVRRADISPTNRGDAAAATWIFRKDESRRRRGRDLDIPQR